MKADGSAFLNVALILPSLFAAAGTIGAEPMQQQRVQENPRALTLAKKADGPVWQDFSERLNQALEDDKKIFAKFDEVMGELEIVKLRATMKRSTQRR